MSLEAASHITGLDSAQPDGLDDISQGDDHLRLIKSVLQADIPLPGKFLRTSTKTSNYSVVVGDYLSILRVTATGVTITTASAASVLGDGFTFYVSAQGFSVTFDPTGSETVNGQPSIVIPANSTGFITTNGTVWTAMIGAGSTAGVGANITGSVTLTVADIKQTRVVTSGPADITLPPTNVVAIGDVITVKSLTYRRTRVLPTTLEFIDGLSTPISVPAYTSIQFQCSSAGNWIISLQPSCYIGEVKMLRHGTIPVGWLEESGGVLSQTDFGGLFGLVGTTFNRGDEGTGNFRLVAQGGRGVIADGTGLLVTPFVPNNIDLLNNTITLAGTRARYPNGLQLTFNLLSGTAPTTTPAGILVDGAQVFVIDTGADGVIKIATTSVNSQNQVPIDITGAGTGTFQFTHTLTARSIGQYIGEERHFMRLDEMVRHTVPIELDNFGAGAQAKPAAALSAATNQTIQSPSVGGDSSMPIMNPVTTARFIIKG